MNKLRKQFIDQYNPDLSKAENTSEYLTSIGIVLDESKVGEAFVMPLQKPIVESKKTSSQDEVLKALGSKLRKTIRGCFNRHTRLLKLSIKTCKQENKPVERNHHGFVVNKEREEIKQKVFDKRGYVCSDCGVKEDLDVHHILPRKMGGKDIISNLKVLCRDCHEKLHGYEIIDDTENKGKGPSKKLILIHKAMDENLKLFIVYKKFDEDQEDYITRRVIDPMELYYENGRQYLKAYCHLRKQQRNFRISRITKIELR